MSEKLLGSFEELVLLAIMKLGDEAYGSPIRRALEEALGSEVSVGALYTTLERLEEKGFVSSRQGDATKQRGGRPKCYYRVEGTGLAALTRTKGARSKMTGDVPILGGLA
jgi:PadR family transcriptional regulator PadR